MTALKDALIIIPTDMPWEWSTDYINQTATILSNTNTVICFFSHTFLSYKEVLVQGQLRKIWKKFSNNQYHYTCFQILPFRRFQAVDHVNFWLNCFVLKCIIYLFGIRNTFKKKVLWIFHPHSAQLPGIFGRSFLSIYDCVDYFQGDKLPMIEKLVIKHSNRLLIEKCDFVCVNSGALYKKFSVIRKDICIVPQGFRYDSFKHIVVSPISIPHDKPVIGYVGGINNRLNFTLLNNIIQTNKNYLFVLVGSVLKDVDELKTRKFFSQLKKYANVLTYESVSKKYIPGIIRQFDIGIIPYNSSIAFNYYCYPMKLFEYFYMGKPVISTPIDELMRFPKYVKIGRTEEEWKKHMRMLLLKPWPHIYRTKQKNLSIANSWEMKINMIVMNIL